MLRILFALLPLFSLLRLNVGEGGDIDDDSNERRVTADEILAKYDNNPRAIAQHASDVRTDRFRLSRKMKQRDDRIAELESKLPSENSLILTPEQAQQWQAYTALGAPTELQSQVEAGRAAQERVATFERDANLALFAEKAGFQNNSVFRLLATRDFDKLSTRDVTEHGKTDKQTIITIDGVVKPLAEHAQEQADWRDALPSLQVQSIQPVPRVPGQSAVSGTAMSRDQLVAQEIERKKASGQYG